jgi:hypothetical protein
MTEWREELLNKPGTPLELSDEDRRLTFRAIRLFIADHLMDDPPVITDAEVVRLTGIMCKLTPFTGAGINT